MTALLAMALSSCAGQTVEQRRAHEAMTPCFKYIDHYFIERDGTFLGVVSGRALYGTTEPARPGSGPPYDPRREAALECMRQQGINPATGRPMTK